MQTRDLSARARRVIAAVSVALASVLMAPTAFAAKADHAPVTEKSHPPKAKSGSAANSRSRAKVAGRPCEMPKRAAAKAKPLQKAARGAKVTRPRPTARTLASPAKRPATAHRKSSSPRKSALERPNESPNETPSRVVVLELEPAPSGKN